MASDLNLAFSVIQRVALGVNSQMAMIPIRHFVLSTTLRRPWALTHFRPLSDYKAAPETRRSFGITDGR